MQLEIRRIADRLDLTVVYVTHDQHEALTMSDRIAIFNDGCIQQIGSAQDIYGRPANRFVAEFVGDNNCLGADVISIEGDLVRARLPSGQEVWARSSVHTKVDQRATIAIRPESVRITGQNRAGTLSGQVSDIIYCGDQFRIHVELPGGERLIAKSSSSLEVQMEMGSPVLLDWEPHDAWALDGR